MARVIRQGWAKPDDEIYTRGAVIGAKRFRPPSKTGKPATPPKATPKGEKK
jgi:hypothetical protein